MSVNKCDPSSPNVISLNQEFFQMLNKSSEHQQLLKIVNQQKEETNKHINSQYNANFQAETSPNHKNHEQSLM